MEKSKEIRDNIVNAVSDEHLVAIKLDLVAGYVHPVLDLGKIEDTCEMERIVHIEMYIEQRILSHRVQGPVEIHIVLLLQVGRFLHPQRLDLVDDIVLVCIHILAVLPFLLLAENYRDRHEFAVFAEQ